MNEEQTSFLLPMGTLLDPKNRWVRLARIVPWDVVTDSYESHFKDRNGGPTPLPSRVAFGALIIKEYLGLTDREVVEQIRENPYLQYFLGRHIFSHEPLFDASMMTIFRKRIDMSVVQAANETLIQSACAAPVVAGVEDDEDNDGSDDNRGDDASENGGDIASSTDDENEIPPSGALLIDATCAPADVTYPTDLKLLNHARELSEQIIDTLHKPFVGKRAKPRTYRKQARRAFLIATKARRLSKRKRRTARGKQLRYVRRNLAYIADFVAEDAGCLSRLDRVLYRKLVVIQELYRQQLYLFESNTTRISDRIVNIAQPHVRPIVRGKAHAPTEFGAKISASIVNGFASLDRLSWDAYNECTDLSSQAEAYRKKTGRYPETIHADRIYRTRINRKWCEARHIRLSGIPPGRPPSDPAAQRERRRQARDDEAARQPIEGVFGCGKRRYGLSRIMTKLAETSATVIAMIFLVMNLEKLLAALVRQLYGAGIGCMHTMALFLLAILEYLLEKHGGMDVDFVGKCFRRVL